MLGKNCLKLKTLFNHSVAFICGYQCFVKMFRGTETVSQIFPTVSRNRVEPHCIITTKIYLNLALWPMTISVFRWNSCGLLKCLNVHQG